MALRAEREGQNPIRLLTHDRDKLNKRGYAYELTIRIEDLPSSLNRDSATMSSYPQNRYIGNRRDGYAVQGFVIIQDNLFAVSPNDPYSAQNAAFIPYEHIPPEGIRATLRRIPLLTNTLQNGSQDAEDLGAVRLFQIKN